MEVGQHRDSIGCCLPRSDLEGESHSDSCSRLRAFSRISLGQAVGSVPGGTIARQIYDGVHAETKGTVEEFYTWDRDRKTLTLEKQ